MDIQGAELSALIGMGEYIENVHLLELEVEFIPIYKDQPTFTDIHSFHEIWLSLARFTFVQIIFNKW